MVTAKQIRCTAVALFLFGTQSWAAVTAFVDRNPALLNESLTLTIESDSGGDKPDFSPLESDFEVMAQSGNTSLQIINGEVSRRQQWQVRLMAKRAGEIQIPPFTVGAEQSQPLLLTVMAQESQKESSSDLYIEVSAAPKNTYVQEQLIYTVKLYFGVNMAEGNTITEPKVEGGDAIVVKLGDNRQYQTSVNGRRYGVMEQQYAIYPQKSGLLTITPPIFEGNVVDQGRSGNIFFDPFNQTTRHLRVSAKALNINVQPMPAGVTSHWLPARSVQLLEQWSDDPPKFVVGEPVTRTLAVMADGLTAAQLPEVGNNLPAGLKSYPDQPQLKDTKDTKGVAGLRQQKIALIPTQPGELTLPAIELAWWNTEKQQMETARLPERTVTVAAGSGVATPLPDNVVPQVERRESAMVTDRDRLMDGVTTTRSAITQAGGWLWLSLLLGLAWLITLIAWWRRRTAPLPKTAVTSSVADQQKLRPLELQLKEACQKNSAVQSKAALMAWAKIRWPQHSVVSLPAVAKLSSAPLADEILALDRVLYSGSDVEWRGELLWRLFNKERAERERSANNSDGALKPLYPDK